MTTTKPQPRDRSYLSVNWQNPINWNHQLNTGLVGWWLVVPHWSGGTVLRDLCGQNHGTLTNMDPATDWVSRSDGFGALDFDGSDDYVDTGKERVGGTGLFADSGERFTVSIWCAIPAFNQGTVIARGSGTAATRTFQIFRGSGPTRTPSFIIRGAQTDVTQSFDDGEFHHNLVTWDGVTARYYFDGEYIKSLNVGTASEESGQRIVLGARTNGTGYLIQAALDDVRIYDRALTANEVRDLYERSKQYQRGLLNRRTFSRTYVSPFKAAIPDIIAGLTSAQSEGSGWNAKVKAALSSANVARTSDTVITITLPEVADYDITAQEIITATIPASVLEGGEAIVATPTFTVDPATGAITVSPVLIDWTPTTPTQTLSLPTTPALVDWLPTTPTPSFSTSLSPETIEWVTSVLTTGLTDSVSPVPVGWTPVTPDSGGLSLAVSPESIEWTITTAETSLSIPISAEAIEWLLNVPTTDSAINITAPLTTVEWSPVQPSVTAFTVLSPESIEWVLPEVIAAATGGAVTVTPLTVEWSIITLPLLQAAGGVKWLVTAVPTHWLTNDDLTHWLSENSATHWKVTE